MISKGHQQTLIKKKSGIGNININEIDIRTKEITTEKGPLCQEDL